jgi:uncharacterized phiE125 gp8 family phage protein
MTYDLPPVLVTAPAADPVSLAEVKAHLRVDSSADDSLIGIYTKAAIAALDGWDGSLRLAIVSQTWRQAVASWPADRVIRLPLGPVSAVSSVIYAPLAGGADVTVNASLYQVQTDAAGALVRFTTDFTAPALADRLDAVRVQFVTGNVDAAAVPAAIKAALLLMIGDLYENRQTVTTLRTMAVPMSTTVERLLTPYRRTTV